MSDDTHHIEADLTVFERHILESIMAQARGDTALGRYLEDGSEPEAVESILEKFGITTYQQRSYPRVSPRRTDWKRGLESRVEALVDMARGGFSLSVTGDDILAEANGRIDASRRKGFEDGVRRAILESKKLRLPRLTEDEIIKALEGILMDDGDQED